MMGGGILDERNDRGFSTLPESEVSMMIAVMMKTKISYNRWLIPMRCFETQAIAIYWRGAQPRNCSITSDQNNVR